MFSNRLGIRKMAPLTSWIAIPHPNGPQAPDVDTDHEREEFEINQVGTETGGI